MSVSDGHYNPKGEVSSVAEFFKLAANWTQFGHAEERGATFGFLTAGPRSNLRVHQGSKAPDLSGRLRQSAPSAQTPQGSHSLRPSGRHPVDPRRAHGAQRGLLMKRPPSSNGESPGETLRFVFGARQKKSVRGRNAVECDGSSNRLQQPVIGTNVDAL